MLPPISRLLRAGRLHGDQGFTLVELLIYVILMGVVTTIVGALFATALNGQRDVTASSQGNNTGQLASQSIANGVRSATYIYVGPSSSTAQLLVVAVPSRKITTASSAYTCKAWYITTSNGGAIYTLSPSTSRVDPTPAALASSWKLLASGVAFSTRPNAPASFFTASGSSVNFEFAMLDGTGRPILISSSATSRQTQIGGTPCG